MGSKAGTTLPVFTPTAESGETGPDPFAANGSVSKDQGYKGGERCEEPRRVNAVEDEEEGGARGDEDEDEDALDGSGPKPAPERQIVQTSPAKPGQNQANPWPNQAHCADVSSDSRVNPGRGRART